MRKYATYKIEYCGFEIEYFITTRTYFENINHNVVIAKIKKENKTIKHLEIPLHDKDKLNKECQSCIEKHLKDYCEYNLKGELESL